MDAILGTITRIEPLGDADGLQRLAVTVALQCLLPARAAAPTWLRGAVVTVERIVEDRREIGEPGDSLVLTVAESARWLRPLHVAPAVASHAPERLALTLYWERGEPPPYTVSGPGGTRTGDFRREGDAWTATADVTGLLPAGHPRPVELTVSCGELFAACSVVPAEPFVGKLRLPSTQVYRLENPWYTADMLGYTGGGTLADWWERGRGVNHFARPAGLIQAPMEWAGLVDRYIMGWHPSEKLGGVALPDARWGEDAQMVWLRLSGRVDPACGLWTSLTCALAREWPLLRWERAFHFRYHARAKDPHVPIDDIRACGQGLRAAWGNEQTPVAGSRLLCAYGGQLVAWRTPEPTYHEHAHGWSPRDGWLLTEHPLRRASTLFLFDPATTPSFGLRVTPPSLALELNWPLAPVHPGSRFSRPLALAAGEICGAAAHGAWVACRIPAAAGVRCALVGRVIGDAPETARFRVGAATLNAPVQPLPLAGIGTVYAAAVDIPGNMNAPFHALFAGIADRRMP